MNDLIIKDNYDLEYQGFKLSSTGLSAIGSPSYSQWEDVGKFIKKSDRCVSFWLGDWVRYGESNYGEMYAQAMDATELDYQTLADDKYVANNVEISRRHENLSFSHHREVASLEPEAQSELLDMAEKNKMPRKEFRNAVKEFKRKLLTSDVKQAGDFSSTISLYSGDMVEVLGRIDTKYDLVVTDPPYNVTQIEWDKIGTPEEFLVKTREWLVAIKSHLKEKYSIFWFCSPSYAADIEMIFRELELPIQSRLVWHRRNMSMGSDSKYKFIDSWEMIFFAGNKELNFPDKWDDSRFDVQTFAVPQTNFEDTKYHPTQKPKDLIEWLVSYGSKEGDTILDPFAGSGTAGAVSTGRKCDLIELDNEYLGIIEQRLNVTRL